MGTFAIGPMHLELKRQANVVMNLLATVQTEMIENDFKRIFSIYDLYLSKLKIFFFGIDK